MRRMIVGAMAGLLVGMAVGGGAARANGFIIFLDASHITSPMLTHQFRIGYATGVFDAMSFVVQANADNAASHQLFAQRFDCLVRRGNTIGEFGSWAERRWSVNSKDYPTDNAASLIMADACKP